VDYSAEGNLFVLRVSVVSPGGTLGISGWGCAPRKGGRVRLDVG